MERIKTDGKWGWVGTCTRCEATDMPLVDVYGPSDQVGVVELREVTKQCKLCSRGTDATSYAAYLRSAVQADYLAQPWRYGSCGTWVDLHDVCDANDYLEHADELLGIDFPDINDEKAWESYLALVNEAIALVEADWPIRLRKGVREDYDPHSELTKDRDGEREDAEAERRRSDGGW